MRKEEITEPVNDLFVVRRYPHSFVGKKTGNPGVTIPVERLSDGERFEVHAFGHAYHKALGFIIGADETGKATWLELESFEVPKKYRRHLDDDQAFFVKPGDMLRVYGIPDTRTFVPQGTKEKVAVNVIRSYAASHLLKLDMTSTLPAKRRRMVKAPKTSDR